MLVAVLAACGSSASSTTPGDDDDVPPDAAEPDAPPAQWSPDPACTGTFESVYVTPAQLPAQRGAVVDCALGMTLDLAATQGRLEDNGAGGVVAETGVRLVKVAYRTQRSNGTAAMTSATVWIPLVPRSLPAPVVLIGRPTSGIADGCAPSKGDTPQLNLAMPFAARGFITITPDFAGLGTDGTHSYLDNHDAVGQLFDGALALQALLPPGTVGDPVAAVGYSQGGGVVLSAQALEHATTGKRSLRGIAAIAPQWPIATDSFGYEAILRNPDRFTALAGLAPPTVAVLRHYGFLINQMGLTGDEAFPAEHQQSITASIESLCTVSLGGALNAQQRRLGDLVDPGFRQQALACIDGTAGCTGLGQAFVQWMQADFVTADSSGARVLIVQGLGDQVMPAASEAACDVAKLRAEGVEPELCTDTFATHDTVLERKIEDVVAWIEAVATGAPPPTCDSQTLPACSR